MRTKLRSQARCHQKDHIKDILTKFKCNVEHLFSSTEKFCKGTFETEKKWKNLYFCLSALPRIKKRKCEFDSELRVCLKGVLAGHERLFPLMFGEFLEKMFCRETCNEIIYIYLKHITRTLSKPAIININKNLVKNLLSFGECWPQKPKQNMVL